MDINKYEVLLTGKAKKDLARIYKYIAKTLKEKNIAQKLMEKIQNDIFILEEVPDGFEVIQYYKKRGYEYRKLIIKNYIAIYRIDKKNNRVYVVRIVYGARDYLNNI